MGNKEALSSAFNMSLGFIPVIVSMLLCEFISQDLSIYIGTAIGILFSYRGISRRGAHLPNFILYISTAMLVLLSLATLLPGDYVPIGALPLTLEVAILIPMLILYLHKKRFINHYIRQRMQYYKRLFAQAAESAVVSARVALILGTLHFITISICIVTVHPLGPTGLLILYHILPPAVFILSITFNQLGINYFNRIMANMEYVPIVNKQGHIIGKTLAVEAINFKNPYINPVIRIAISSHRMLYLCPRSAHAMLDKGKVDVPLECYLRYGETLAECANRMIRNALPEAGDKEPIFTVSYHFENKVTNRLVYLFIIDIEDDSILRDSHLKHGKLWTFQQIEDNIGRHFFSECFEHEYEHLKQVIDIREKYKES